MTESSNNEVERRKSFRLDMEKELVDITWQDENGLHKKKKIVCLDFSRGGLKLDCDEAIAVSTAITVLFKAANPNSQKLEGKVLRCIKQENDWFEIALILEI
ncbi:PilZ domain-containing protein [Colwellia sp. TT2012]|uniref:PilZ domain-containing protein n=1 Tax=Colwellia sp. TT2012 TaxID=1720342 RepID=UPI00070FEF12|nr:PilZ domain-containing protein [Colwellia sp. TT2012]